MMAKQPKPRKSAPSALDEADLFRAVMTDAVPLDDEIRQRFAPTTDVSAPKPVANPTKRTTVRKIPGSTAIAVPPPKKTRQPGDTFDRVTLRQVKQGKMTVEGRLDLHGMTQTQAHSRLHRFIESAARDGKRCVLVITGKGVAGGRPGHAATGGPVGRGILRKMTPQWLSGADLAPFVVDFQASLPKDGGTGALYVRLRRPK